jgi:hypothetical protein
MAVMCVPDGALATALTLTGEATVEPEVGEQIFTVPAFATQVEPPLPTVKVDFALHTAPRLFHALTTIECDPEVKDNDAFTVLPVEVALVTLSMYTFMAVTVVPLGAVAAAETLTGEFTVAPLVGVQMLTDPATPDGEH